MMIARLGCAIPKFGSGAPILLVLALSWLALLADPDAAMALGPAVAIRSVDARTSGEDPRAWLDLARRFENAEGVTRDYQAALELYCRAASAGVAEAAHSVGWMYLNGRGVDQNDDAAASWFGIAADMGHAFSRKLLAKLPSAQRTGSADCPSQPDEAISIGTGKLDLIAPAWIKDLSQQSAAALGLDPNLLLAVIATESGFDSSAVSSKHAQGLMQLIPETAERFGVADPFNPAENIRGGAEYLKWLIDHFDGDLRLALAGYNAGESAVRAYAGVPPYPETIRYIEKVRELYDHPDLRTGHPADAQAVQQDLEVTLVGGRYLGSR